MGYPPLRQITTICQLLTCLPFPFSTRLRHRPGNTKLINFIVFFGKNTQILNSLPATHSKNVMEEHVYHCVAIVLISKIKTKNTRQQPFFP